MISKLPKSFTTTKATFDEKSEKFELFEDLLQIGLKIHNQLTKEGKIKELFTLSSVVLAGDFQKHQQPEPKESGRSSACFRKKIHETLVKGYGKTQFYVSSL